MRFYDLLYRGINPRESIKYTANGSIRVIKVAVDCDTQDMAEEERSECDAGSPLDFTSSGVVEVEVEWGGGIEIDRQLSNEQGE